MIVIVQLSDFDDGPTRKRVTAAMRWVLSLWVTSGLELLHPSNPNRLNRHYQISKRLLCTNT